MLHLIIRFEKGFHLNWFLHHLKVQSCKLYDKKYMIALTQIASTEIFCSRFKVIEP